MSNSTILKLPTPAGVIKRRIHIIRGQQVMLDSDLAELYQVPTKALNQGVRRNKGRFPEDFMFQLSKNEASSLRSQIVTLEKGRGRYSKYDHLAFTEHGVAMLASVLKSTPAVEMSILIIRSFIQMRKSISDFQNLSDRLVKVESTQKLHGQVLTGLITDIKKIKNPPKINAIGFKWKVK